MDKTLESIMKRLEEHERIHKRTDIGRERRQLIRESYQCLKSIEKKAFLGVRFNKSSITVRIISRRLLACREYPSLLILVGLSNICIIKTHKNVFIIDLVFDLWKWEKKEVSLQTE